MREYEDFTFFSESVARTMGFHTTAHAGEAAGARGSENFGPESPPAAFDSLQVMSYSAFTDIVLVESFFR